MLGHSIVSQHFMEPEGSIPNSQELSTCSYPEPPIQSTSLHPTSLRSILILSTHLLLGLPSGLFPSGFPTNNPLLVNGCLKSVPLQAIKLTWPCNRYTGNERVTVTSSVFGWVHAETVYRQTNSIVISVLTRMGAVQTAHRSVFGTHHHRNSMLLR
jgi:hypothetical protein